MKALRAVRSELEAGNPLTLEMVGDVFGQAFWVLLVYEFMDAQLAARAIQNAIARLSAGAPAEGN